MNPAHLSPSLGKAFTAASGKLLSIYTMAGFPRLDSLHQILPALDAAGTDFIEIGIPFSDPLADGPVIQAAALQALQNGMHTDLLFKQLAEISTQAPLVLMGYLNTVLHYGFERFCAQCAACRITGLILPDLPADIWESQYKHMTDAHGISVIFLVAPQTSEARIRQIDALSSSFIYAVSNSSTTGNSQAQGAHQYLRDLREMQLDHPVMTGFNIRDRQSFLAASEYTSGGIIGSAFLEHIREDDSPEQIASFIQTIRP